MFLTLKSGSPKTGTLKTKAFTLIELLVVIAIIALLMSIVVPALRLAKLKAASAVCLANVKNLSLAWYAYQEDNDGRLVNPNLTSVDSDGKHDNPDYIGWVLNPIRPDGVTMCQGDEGPLNPVTDEDEIRGIEKGALFAYLDDPDVYHCPTDQRRAYPDESKLFRSYASPRALGRVNRFSRIVQPGMRFSFIEEAEGRNWNVGTWDFYNMAENGYWEWRDPVGNNHGGSGIIGFCDGHAEVHKWQESFTLDRVRYYFDHASEITGYGSAGGSGLNDKYPRKLAAAPAAENDRDIAYIAKGWADRARRE